MMEDLNKSHYKIWERNPEISQSKEHTKKSTEFAISLLKLIIGNLEKEINTFEGEDLTDYDLGIFDGMLNIINDLNTTIGKLEEKL